MTHAVPPTLTTQADGITQCRLVGSHGNLQAVVDEVAAALTAARDAGVHRLLVDGSGIGGFAAPSLAERHALIRRWAAAAWGRMVVALACPAELIDPERFGVVAAANFGLTANVFTNADDALAWLRTL